MWKCTKCGEQIDDQFQSCWKCAKAPSAEETPDESTPEVRNRHGFWCAWRRGLFVLLMVLIVSMLASLVRLFLQQANGLVALVGVAAALFLLPLCAYWVFLLFFGQEAWPIPNNRKTPPEDAAFALLGKATKLEARGRVQEALTKYEQVTEKFPGTLASLDAQKSRDSLRANIPAK